MFSLYLNNQSLLYYINILWLKTEKELHNTSKKEINFWVFSSGNKNQTERRAGGSHSRMGLITQVWMAHCLMHRSSEALVNPKKLPTSWRIMFPQVQLVSMFSYSITTKYEVNNFCLRVGKLTRKQVPHISKFNQWHSTTRQARPWTLPSAQRLLNLCCTQSHTHTCSSQTCTLSSFISSRQPLADRIYSLLIYRLILALYLPK